MAKHGPRNLLNQSSLENTWLNLPKRIVSSYFQTHKGIWWWLDCGIFPRRQLIRCTHNHDTTQYTSACKVQIESRLKWKPGRTISAGKDAGGTVLLQFAVFRRDQRHLNGLRLNAAAAAPTSAVPRWHAGYSPSFLLLCRRNSQHNGVRILRCTAEVWFMQEDLLCIFLPAMIACQAG